MSRLSYLRVGDQAFVEGFEPIGSGQFTEEQADSVKALLKMGVLPGSEIIVVSRALTGDPIAIEVRGARIAIGKKEASLICVKEVSL